MEVDSNLSIIFRETSYLTTFAGALSVLYRFLYIYDITKFINFVLCVYLAVVDIDMNIGIFFGGFQYNEIRPSLLRGSIDLLFVIKGLLVFDDISDKLNAVMSLSGILFWLPGEWAWTEEIWDWVTGRWGPYVTVLALLRLIKNIIIVIVSY